MSEKKSTYQRVKEERDAFKRQYVDAIRTQFALMDKCDELEDQRDKLYEQVCNSKEEYWKAKYEEECERYRNLWNDKAAIEHKKLCEEIDKKERELKKTKEAEQNALKLFMKQVDETCLNKEMVAWLLKRSPWLKWLFEKRVKEGYFKKRINESD